MSEYSFASKSVLKLKGVENAAKKKKKDRKKNMEVLEVISEAGNADCADAGKKDVKISGQDYNFYKNKTKTELAFLKKKEEMNLDRIRKKADLSHKDKVEKFNSHLNSLTEHYDIAKVSWTK